MYMYISLYICIHRPLQGPSGCGGWLRQADSLMFCMSCRPCDVLMCTLASLIVDCLILNNNTIPVQVPKRAKHNN